MTGSLIIDGVDIFTEYGISITDGGYNGFIAHASLKEIDTNDWPEEDGIEADLSNPVLDTKEFSVSFGGIDYTKIETFFAFLSDGAYHEFEFSQIMSSKRLRLVSQPDKECIMPYESFSLKFADDFPLKGYTYLAPTGSVPQTGFEVDGKPLSDYGVMILDDSYDEITKIPPVKKNLTSSYRNISGINYDDYWVKYQSKDVNLKCLLQASSLTIFWRNWNALLYDFIRPGERKFYVQQFEDTFLCFYKGCLVSLFTIISGEIWCEFTFTLTFTNFRPKFTYYVWGTQDNKIIITEDEKNLIKYEK